MEYMFNDEMEKLFRDVNVNMKFNQLKNVKTTFE